MPLGHAPCCASWKRYHYGSCWFGNGQPWHMRLVCKVEELDCGLYLCLQAASGSTRQTQWTRMATASASAAVQSLRRPWTSKTSQPHSAGDNERNLAKVPSHVGQRSNTDNGPHYYFSLYGTISSRGCIKEIATTAEVQKCQCLWPGLQPLLRIAEFVESRFAPCHSKIRHCVESSVNKRDTEQVMLTASERQASQKGPQH